MIQAELNWVNRGTGLFGRDNLLDIIIGNFDETTPETARKRCICIRGDHGTGKTALLSELQNRLSHRIPHVFSSFGQENDGAVRMILKQFADVFDTGDDPDFHGFIMSYANGIIDGEPAYDRNSIIKYIYDCVKDKSVPY